MKAFEPVGWNAEVFSEHFVILTVEPEKEGS